MLEWPWKKDKPCLDPKELCDSDDQNGCACCSDGIEDSPMEKAADGECFDTEEYPKKTVDEEEGGGA